MKRAKKFSGSKRSSQVFLPRTMSVQQSRPVGGEKEGEERWEEGQKREEEAGGEGRGRRRGEEQEEGEEECEEECKHSRYTHWSCHSYPSEEEGP